jgi:hypothetical protein
MVITPPSWQGNGVACSMTLGRLLPTFRVVSCMFSSTVSAPPIKDMLATPDWRGPVDPPAVLAQGHVTDPSSVTLPSVCRVISLTKWTWETDDTAPVALVSGG